MNVVTTETDVLTEGAAGSFSDYRLRRETIDALAKMGIHSPTPIQHKALPALLDGNDVIGQARTGSGKTLAFGIPGLEVVDANRKEVQALVLTPTRELAVQVAGVLEDLGKSRGIKVGLLFGGRSLGPQRIMLRNGVHVVVGTPGRVLDMIHQGMLWLDKVRFLVLDEADEMLDRGFAPDVERILDRATSARQTALFSATVPDWVRKTADRHLHDPISVMVDTKPDDVAPIDHIAYDVGDLDKVDVLKDLLDHQGDGSIIVFGRTKHGVKKLARKLSAAGYPVAALQGNLSQNARDAVMADFRSGRIRVLLATNVAARGLDVTHVEQVINVELPESHQLMTHRIGRTGRMGRQGRAITLLSREDASKWRQLERGFGRSIPRAQWQGASSALTDAPDEIAAAMESKPAGNRNSNARSAPRKKNVRRGTIRTNPTQEQTAQRERQPSAQNGFSGKSNAPRTRRPRPQFEIECSACGVETTVPFEPDRSRPVYCQECYRAMKPSDPTRSSRRGRSRSEGATVSAAD